MNRSLFAFCCVLLMFVLGVLYSISSRTVITLPDNMFPPILRLKWHYEETEAPSLQPRTTSLQEHPSVIFVESTDTLTPQPLVICAVESSARIYHNWSVTFFLRGLKNRTCLQNKRECPGLSLLADLPNVHILPLDPKVVLEGTPFMTWFDEDKLRKETHWIRITSDAYRLAIMWNSGGLYFDTDVITIKQVPIENIVVSESNEYVSSGVFGFHKHHPFVMECMKDFVQNYNGAIWGQQGPLLLTRVIKRACALPQFSKLQDFSCDAKNLTFMHPTRFYPIDCSQWEKYFQVWEKIPDFSDSYGLHLWNYMNRNQIKKMIVPGSNTLVENLFIKYCPSTYDVLIKNGK
ncbi:alpha-1,4-N-acetylglucosaminyltransferase-like [Protopterus annectens]|uniref:alpha-1,4-N-acetylglucosaminyltransferase-like n=1 Tax=Protopterus annectens TaxID=7888 RepID=UPI001CFBB8E3|nr:alpha-1,4-N-acetylglucosaminyltransferase-like [Protopterus annectens]